MEQKNVHPFLSISQRFSEGDVEDIDIYPENINEFFKYLSNPKISQKDKAMSLHNLMIKVKENRTISEYFSKYEGQSIYIFLFKLYIDQSSTDIIRVSILNLINELRINIEADKNSYDLIFQKISSLYREEGNVSSDKLSICLNFLNSILGETEKYLKPRNYYACTGNCKFYVVFGKGVQLMPGYALTFILSFKLGACPQDNVASLVKIEFSSGYQLDIDLKDPGFIIVKKITDTLLKSIPKNEWITLVINLIINNNNAALYFMSNGENRLTPFKLPAPSIKYDDSIKSISFFDNFYGEVTSIIMLSQETSGTCIVNSNEFLVFFKQFKEGFWREKKFDKFIEKVKSLEPNGNDVQKSQSFQAKAINLTLKLLDSKIEFNNSFYDNLLFAFTPFSHSLTSEDIIENCLSIQNYKLKYSGNIRLHNYYCYQNKLHLIGVIKNILPIAEMFLIHPETLNENNFKIYLEIIENILKYRKYNVNAFNEYQVFPILSLFFEKYPKKCYTENILNIFVAIGKAIFSTENLCETYFQYILLNEKIISKYNQDLQIKFWEYIILFCKADRTQIERLLNMNRLCLILRYYDRNKYTQMCCKEHLATIKPEFIGSDVVMNPPMNQIVKTIKDSMDIIISGTDPKNALNLFKLLTLDLSPCLTKFIINTFLTALQNQSTDENWKNNFVLELIDSKFEIIMMNTFIHSLLEIRINILTLIYEIHKRLTSMHRGTSKSLEKMLKTCLIPQKMFYFSKKEISEIYAEENKKILQPTNTIYSTNDEVISSMLKEKIKNENLKKIKTEIGENEILLFKDEYYEEYKDKLLNAFLLWSLGKNIDTDFGSFDIKQSVIKYANILEVLFLCDDELNDPDFTLKFIQLLELLVDKQQNAYNLLLNKKIISSILDMAFRMFNSDDQIIKSLYNKARSLITNIFNNTIRFLEKSRVIFPFDEIDTGIFLWGDKLIITGNNNKMIKENLFDFLDDLLLEILTAFKVSFEPQMKFTLTSQDFIPSCNFYLKNYLILITHLFRFSFQYKYDSSILTEGISFLPPSQKIISVLELYISSMRIITRKGNNIVLQWAEFPFFDEIFKRLHLIWSKANTFKNIIADIKRGNKLLKYEEVLQKMILDKDNKNLFLRELKILTYEENSDSKEYIIPLIKIISISLMCVLANSIYNPDFRYWLKEFKNFVRFIILASTNMTRKDQVDFYMSVQQKCANTLITCFSFWKDLTLVNSEHQGKIQQGYTRMLLFCSLILKYQYQYCDNHKLKMKLFKKMNKNDLMQCAIFDIFAEKIKDANGEPLLNFDKVNKFSEFDFYEQFKEMDNNEWKNALYENSQIKELLDRNYFCLIGYKVYVDKRYQLFQMIKDEQDDKYKEDILLLLPMYEDELAKVSNNSLENNKKIKNSYKRYKKESFCWGGYWSDRNLFYKDFDKLKLKIMNHYTKTFMKPILAPILDMSYYLPEFSGFDPETLFDIEQEKKDKACRLAMDIDKILKTNASQANTNTKGTKENFLRRIYIKSNPNLAKNLLKISNNLDFGKEEEFAILQKTKDQKSDNSIKNKYFLGCLVKASHHIKGVFFIDEDGLNFKVFLNQKTGNSMNDVEVAFKTTDDDYDHERNTCFGSYFVCHPKDKDLYKLSINYNNIKYLLRRRYYYKNSAIEIYTSTNKTYYFNFKYEQDRETAIQEILQRIKEYATILDDLKEPKDMYENNVGYQNTLVLQARKKSGKKKYKIKLSKKILAWKEWRMSTYELLMWLNIYSNRSFNDISQYPVFPWILSNYEDPLIKDSNNYEYRDLSLPMGMLALNEEGEKRKESFMETYDVLKNESDGSMKPYIYGSNYSNPMYVCHFMMRLFPFTHISIELQGNKFDDANRLFLSVKGSFYNSITQKTDVKELIPEFFYMPEMFLNVNKLNLGVEENGNKVNNVATPCQNNPYEFILTMKQALENDYISYSIQNWIDLIFGIKSKGKEAEMAYNLFTEASYQEDVNINSIEDKESFLRRVEFGLIPNQILTKEFNRREKKEEFYKDKQIFDCSAKLIGSSAKLDNEQNIMRVTTDDTLILKVKSFSDKIILILNNDYIVEEKVTYSLFDRDYKDEVASCVEFGQDLNRISEFYYNAPNNEKAIEICNQGKTIIMGGFYDGKVKVKYFGLESSTIDDNYIEFKPFNEDTVVLALSVDEREKYLIIGNSKGNVVLYEINLEEKKLKRKLLIYEQMSPISHLYCSSQLNLWVSASIDGCVNIYTLPLCKLVRSIKIETQKCSYAFLADSPLPCIVVICNEGEAEAIYSYSINGKLISKKTEGNKINKPTILKDAYFNSYLAYLSGNSFNIINLPQLEYVLNVDNLKDPYNFCANEDVSMVIVFNKNGSEVTLIRDESKKNIRPPSFVMKNLVNIK